MSVRVSIQLWCCAIKVRARPPQRSLKAINKYGDHTIGLFQGMFDKNTLTFNPGWDSNASRLEDFTDVRDLQRELKAQGVPRVAEADESTTGPAYFLVIDPDGNQVLVDQHV